MRGLARIEVFHRLRKFRCLRFRDATLSRVMNHILHYKFPRLICSAK